MAELDRKAQYAQFETLGEDHVRDIVKSWSQPLHGMARDWLKMKRQEADARAAALWEKDQEDRARMEASSAEQIRLTLEANQIARQARNAARAALIVATVGSIAAIAALFIH